MSIAPYHLSGEGEASFTEILGENVVIDSNLPVLTLEYATTPVDITARKEVRIANHATLSNVCVPAGGRPFITKNVRVLDIVRVEELAAPIDLETSTTELEIRLGTGFDAPIATLTKVLDGTVRKITGSGMMCDGQALLAGVGSMSEAAACAALGMSEHVCTFDGSVDDWVVNGHIDYSCPCTTHVIPCRTHFNTARVGISDITTDTLVLGSRVTELTGVTGKAMRLQVASAMDQLSITATNSFVALDDANMLLTLEMSGRVYVLADNGVEILSKRLANDTAVKAAKGLAMHTLRIGNDASTCGGLRLLENEELNCIVCRGNTVQFGSACRSPNNGHCSVLTQDTCVRCQDGFYMDGGCVTCPSSHPSCDLLTGDCMRCEDGYTLTNGKCVAVSACPCDFYRNDVCHVCLTNAYFQPPTTPGDAFCFNCTDSNCLACNTGSAPSATCKQASCSIQSPGSASNQRDNVVCKQQHRLV